MKLFLDFQLQKVRQTTDLRNRPKNEFISVHQCNKCSETKTRWTRYSPKVNYRYAKTETSQKILEKYHEFKREVHHRISRKRKIVVNFGENLKVKAVTIK